MDGAVYGEMHGGRILAPLRTVKVLSPVSV
jgi:hypothetical protein